MVEFYDEELCECNNLEHLDNNEHCPLNRTLQDVVDEAGIEVTVTEIDLDGVAAQIPEQWVDNMVTWNEGLDAWMSSPEFEPQDYSILAVWPAVVVQQDDLSDVQDFFSGMGCKHPIIPIGVVYTLPDYGDRLVHPEEGDIPTGGRPDFTFYFHNADIPLIAVRRLQYGIRWWEDVIANERNDAEEESLPYEEYSIYRDSFRETFGETGFIVSERELLPTKIFLDTMGDEEE